MEICDNSTRIDPPAAHYASLLTPFGKDRGEARAACQAFSPRISSFPPPAIWYNTSCRQSATLTACRSYNANGAAIDGNKSRMEKMQGFTGNSERYMEACRFDNLRQVFPQHFHEYYVLGALLAGERLFKTPQGEIELRAPAVVLLPPGQVHGCQPIGECGSSWLALNISRGAMELIASGSPTSCEGAVTSVDGRLAAEIEAIGEFVLAGRAGGKGAELRAGRSHSVRFCATRPSRELVWRLADAIARIAGCRGSGKIGQTRRMDWIRERFAWLEEFLTASSGHPPTLDELAASTSMDKFGIIRGFRRLAGVPPHKYAEMARLGKCQFFLRSGADLADAAVNSGYFDQSHCAKNYRKMLGYTPGLYRRAWLEACASKSDPESADFAECQCKLDR